MPYAAPVNEIKEPITIVTDDGWTLRGEWIPGPNPAAPLVMASHAMWVDRRTLTRRGPPSVVSALQDAGLNVCLVDLRGHGESGPHATDGADFSYDDIVRYDLPAIFRYGRTRMPNAHLTVLGHSLTGHAAMIAAGLATENVPDAIVGIASNLWLPKLDRNARTSLSKQLALTAWSLVAGRKGHFDAKRMRLGQWGVPAAYVQQFAEMFTRNQLGPSGGRAEYEEALRRVHIPIYTLASEGDRILSTPDNVAAFMALMPHAAVTRRVLWRRDGAPQPDHMGLVLNPECEDEWHAIAAWIHYQAKTVTPDSWKEGP